MNKSTVFLSFILSVVGGTAGGFLHAHFIADRVDAVPVNAPPPVTIKVDEEVAEKTPHELYDDCTDEISNFCDQKRDQLLELAGCLEGVKERLSTKCRQDVSRIHMILLPCHDETHRFCSSVPLGGGRLHRCLAQNLTQSGEKCRKALAGI